MALIKYRSNPVTAEPFTNFFDDFFGPDFFVKRNEMMKRNFTPATNIKQNEKSYTVELAAPGFKKEDFKIEIDKDVLTIKNEFKEENEQNNGSYNVREFSLQSFSKSFNLPEGVNAEEVTAEYIDGVLKLEIPKAQLKEAEKPKQIAVK